MTQSQTGRRGFLKGAAVALAVPAAATIAGGVLTDTAYNDTPGLPDYAPIPAASLGPALNADGYYVGRIAGNLYWVTDAYYQAMFLSTRRGVVLVDAPPTIGHYAPDYATLMMVDVLFPGWVPFENLAVSEDIPDWVEAQSIAMDYPWQTLVGGHLGRLGTRADGKLQIQYMNDLDAGVRAATASVDPTQFFAKYGAQGNAWAIFKTYLDAVAQTAAAPVTAKYTGLLAAADVFTVDNAWTLLESLRIDTGILGPFGVRPRHRFRPRSPFRLAGFRGDIGFSRVRHDFVPDEPYVVLSTRFYVPDLRGGRVC